jgi:hypothetical protein
MNIKINWEKSKNPFNERTFEFTDDNYFRIIEVDDKTYELGINKQYIRAFDSFKKAEKVVELILEG